MMYDLRSTELRLIAEFIVDAVSIAASSMLVCAVIWEVDTPAVREGKVVWQSIRLAGFEYFPVAVQFNDLKSDIQFCHTSE